MYKKKNKYSAKKTEIDGIIFHSKLEAKHYQILKLRQQIGEIRDLKLQVKFPLDVNESKICTYIADFTFYEDNKFIVADAKGVITESFRLKRKLVKAIYGHDILLLR